MTVTWNLEYGNYLERYLLTGGEVESTEFQEVFFSYSGAFLTIFLLGFVSQLSHMLIFIMSEPVS